MSIQECARPRHLTHPSVYIYLLELEELGKVVPWSMLKQKNCEIPGFEICHRVTQGG